MRNIFAAGRTSAMLADESSAPPISRSREAESGDMTSLWVETGHHLHIPAGVPYALLNPYGAPTVATEYRPVPVAHADTEYLPPLTPQVQAHTQRSLITDTHER